MRKLCRFVFSLVVLSFFSCSLHPALAQAPEPRLRDHLSDSNRTVLRGSRSPLATAGQDLGPLPSDRLLTGVTLVFKRSAAQQADLDSLLAAQQNTSSAQFHHWLTPGAFATRFGMADADLAMVSAWLAGHGFHVDDVPPAHDRITFSGTVAQLNATFNANLHTFDLQGEHLFAPATDLSLPATLIPVVSTVEHLSSLRPRPTLKASPAYTDASSGAHYLAPPDLPVMYDASSVAATANGQGQSVAIVGESYLDPSSYVTSVSLYFDNPDPTAIFVPGSGNQVVSPGDLAESDIDTQYATALAKGASVYLVYVGDGQNYNVFDAVQYAIATDLAPVISISYSSCEVLLSASDLDQENALFMQAAAQGQTLVASSGDNGSTGCAQYTTTQGVSTAVQQALAVGFPASSPYVTAIGGLQMAPGTFAAGASQYWSTPGSQLPAQSLLSYVPEVAWNEDVSGSLPFAGGGGSSAHFPRPSWQSALSSFPAGAFRLVPDVSLQASASDPGFIFCTRDTLFYRSEGGRDSSCSQGLVDRNGLYTRAGGTSFGAPVFAGFIAALNQVTQSSGQGNLNPTLYALAADPNNYASIFHDVVTGSIACTAGVLNCGPEGQGSYAAGVGFDEATGLGSFDAAKLIAAWPSSAASGLQSTFVKTSIPALLNASADPGSTQTMNITVSTSQDVPSPTPPTGSVSVTLDGALVSASTPLADTGSSAFPSAAAAYTVTAPALPGTHVLVVSYAGDASHAASRFTQALMVGSVTPSGGLTLTAANITLAPNSQGTLQVTAVPTGGYHGRLFWDLSYTESSASTALTGCYGLAPLLVSSTGVSSDTLALGIGQACSASASSGKQSFKGPVAASGRAPQKSDRLAPVLSVSACLLVCGAFVRRRRVLLQGALLASLLAVASSPSLLGCGSTAATQAPSPTPTPAPTNPTPTASTYTFTLHAVDSVNAGISASTNFTLTVTN